MADILPVKGVKALTHIVTCPDKQIVLSVLCSLLNTVSLSWEVTEDPTLIHADHEIQSCQLAGSL